MTTNPENAHSANLRGEFHSSRLLPSITAGMICGISGLSMCISFALLIFSGSLSDFLPVGIGLVLFTGFILNMLIALTSSSPGIFAGPGDSAVVILAAVAADIAGRMGGAASAQEILATVLAAIALMSLLTGVFFFVLGRLKTGNLVRYIPFPVIGGFLAGTGWLMFKGSIEIMSDTQFAVSTLSVFFQSDKMIMWMPGLIFGAVVLIASRLYRHYLVMPALLASAIGAFYLVLWMTDTSLAQASAQGWLLEPMPSGAIWRPVGLSLLLDVNWSMLLLQVGNFGTVLLVSLVQFLLYVSGIELAFERDIDLDRELKATGFMNLVASLGAGIPGFHWPGLSTLAKKMGVSGRLFGVVAGLLFGIPLVAGSSLLSYFPIYVLGGLLTFIALSFLVEWVYDGWFKLSKADYAIVILILIVIGSAGFLQGVGAGILAAVILFVADYSRVHVVKNALSGSDYQSNIERPLAHRQALLKYGDHTYILKLTGFLFFGTANRLFEQIKDRAGNPDALRLRFMVLDFRQVSGFDSSALLSFVRMRQFAQVEDLELVFTHLTPIMQRQLEKEKVCADGSEHVHQFADLDHGVEWCENRILQSYGLLLSLEERPINAQLDAYFSNPGIADRLLTYLEKREVDAECYLMRQGEAADDLYFVASGSVEARLETEGGRGIRLRRMGAGTVVGEIGIYTGEPRTASVVTTQPGVVYRLSADALNRMQQDDADVATAFHRFVVRNLSERLAGSNKYIQALLD